MPRGLVQLGLVACVVAAATTGAANGDAAGAEVTQISRHGITVLLPPHWHGVDRKLTPCIDPSERLTVAGGGALVMLQERLRPVAGEFPRDRMRLPSVAVPSTWSAALRCRGEVGCSDSRTMAEASMPTSTSANAAPDPRHSRFSTAFASSPSLRSSIRDPRGDDLWSLTLPLGQAIRWGTWGCHTRS